MHVAGTDRWELLFDSVIQSRKHQNLLNNPRVAFVIGCEHKCTVQYEGIAEMPTEAELPHVQGYYFEHFPDGPTRKTWPGLVYWRVRPTWIRYSNFNVNPPIIQEWDAAAIAGSLVSNGRIAGTQKLLIIAIIPFGGGITRTRCIALGCSNIGPMPVELT